MTLSIMTLLTSSNSAGSFSLTQIEPRRAHLTIPLNDLSANSAGSSIVVSPTGNFDVIDDETPDDIWSFWLNIASATLDELWDNEVDAEYDDL